MRDQRCRSTAPLFLIWQYSMSTLPEHLNDDKDLRTSSQGVGSDRHGGDHTNLWMLSQWRPMRLLQLVVALQGHRLTVLHLNMTRAGHIIHLTSRSKTIANLPLWTSSPPLLIISPRKSKKSRSV